MKRLPYLVVTLMLLVATGCKKEDRIRHELSGVWEIEKSVVSDYSSGVLHSVTTLENLGTLNLSDDKSTTAHEFNKCYFDFAPSYWPVGFEELNNTSTRQNGYCNWYADLRSRDRVTLWSPGGFANADEIFVTYTRIKNANGPGRREQWQYIRLNASGLFVYKEVLFLKLVNARGDYVQ